MSAKTPNTDTNADAMKPATVEDQINLGTFKGKLETPIRAIFDADLFARACNIVSTEDTRYYLQGVHVEPAPETDGVLLVATDGHRLICLRDVHGYYSGKDDGSIIRALPHFLRMVRKPKTVSVAGSFASRDYKIVVVDRLMALVELTHGTPLDERGRAALFQTVREPSHLVLAVQTNDVLIDGTFPDWQRVVPVLDPDAAPGLFSEKLLAGIANVLTDSDNRGIRLTRGAGPHGKRGDDQQPVLVRADCARIDGFGVIMPLRGTMETKTYPDWMKVETMAERDARIAADAKKLKAEMKKAAKKIDAMSATRAKTRETPPRAAAKKPAKKAAPKKAAPKKAARRRAA